MNPLSSVSARAALQQVTLEDKYTREQGRIYVSGVQALARLPMLQRDRDRRAGLNTGGYVSGYRGSPLAGLDLALWRARLALAGHDVVFQPGLNEDLAATAVWGSQQLNLYPGALRDGVFGMWYGKGPGLDRSADVFKHANSAGTSPLGGVLLLAGDDHGAKSSSIAHQSEHLLAACGIPVLYPANVQEYLDFGLHGWAMSRYTGLWVAMKCVTDVVESSASVEVDPERVRVVLPEDFVMPPGGLNIRWPDTPLAQEARMLDYKWYAASAYVGMNGLNRVMLDSPNARFGIMAAGKAYLDVRQALADLGLDEATCAQIGIRVLKVGCVWPLNAHDARGFATGLEEILVVEEKRQFLEYALKEALYNWREDVRPRVYGKFDERPGWMGEEGPEGGSGGGEWSVPRGEWLLPARGELSPALIAKAIAGRIERMGLLDVAEGVRARVRARIEVIEAKAREAARPRVTVERKPWFCSGCPHNTSTRVPEGSRAMAGIGCHYMVLWMDRRTETFSQMGGEGVGWLGQMHFSGDRHVFVNLGDGTYCHSGSLAIRAAVVAGANVTYKILYNDAVAMTGGQPLDGGLTVPRIARQVLAEGVGRVVVVSDAPEKYAGQAGMAGGAERGAGSADVLPVGVQVYHRDELDAVQRVLRDTSGVSVLIYDQTCAAEKRRRRKRGAFPDPARRAFINPAVCEGCGDCSVVSNCLSVEPLETPLGTKRRINQSSCNKDFSCVKGFCPSFVTAEGAQLRRPQGVEQALVPEAEGAGLPEPKLPGLERPYGILVTGVGGTGVITIGALLGMAAHLEGKGVTVLDMTGLAQKGGAVLSHVQIALRPEEIYSTRIPTGEAEVLLGCDEIVSASAETLSRVRYGVTRAVVNCAGIPAADFIGNPDWKFPRMTTEQDIRTSIGEACEFVDANGLALRFLGDTLYANPLVLGYAWQQGWIPLGKAALLRAIELNGAEVERNVRAFELGRWVAHDPVGVLGGGLEGGGGVAGKSAGVVTGREDGVDEVLSAEGLAGLVEARVGLLTDYQNGAYAARYREAVERVRVLEQGLQGLVDGEGGEDGGNVGQAPLLLTEAVARNLAKLMAYKDEYEVARLQSSEVFRAQLRAQFEGEPGRDYVLNYYLAVPVLARRGADGLPLKRRYGPWMGWVLRGLARCKGLRGTVFDPFGWLAERRQERQLVEDYFALIELWCRTLTAPRLELAIELARLPEQVRGFGEVKGRSIAAVALRREALLRAYGTVGGVG